MRLDKLLAHTGYGTRKEVRDLIKKGTVTVDQQIVKKNNIHVNPDEQFIQVDGEVVNYQKYIYILLHKPPNYLSATVDAVDQTVIDLVPEKYKHFDLAPVGRLDKDTEGLLLLTNDGQVNHALTSPRRTVWKTYFAKIDGKVTNEHVEKFKEGIILDDGYKTKPAHLTIEQSNEQSEIKLSIVEGKFHQVKRMFRAVRMEVTYLKRIRMGELQLDKNLKMGQTRLLTENELAYVLSIKK